MTSMFLSFLNKRSPNLCLFQASVKRPVGRAGGARALAPASPAPAFPGGLPPILPGGGETTATQTSSLAAGGRLSSRLARHNVEIFFIHKTSSHGRSLPACPLAARSAAGRAGVQGMGSEGPAGMGGSSSRFSGSPIS